MNLYEKSDISNLTLLKKAINKNFKICYVDIETSPMLSWHYGCKKLFIRPEQIEQDCKVTSAVAMWEYDQNPLVFEWDNGDDQNLVKSLSEVLNKADLVIMQNGDRFDAPMIQERLKNYKLPPLINLITLDTLKLSRRSFNIPHHSLDSRSRRYGFGGKIKQDMEDAIAVAKGDKLAQKKRIEYNIKDVVDMRKVFWREFNYYSLPQRFLTMLKLFTREDKPYCVKCASRRQSKFKVMPIEVKNNKGVPVKKWHCENCQYTWSRREDLSKNRKR